LSIKIAIKFTDNSSRTFFHAIPYNTISMFKMAIFSRSVLLFTFIISLSHLVVADFHIYFVSQTQACGQPGTSNTFCDTYAYTLVDAASLSCTAAVNGPEARQYPVGPGVALPDTLNFDDGICDSGPLDFYRNGNGGYDYYHSGGDGSVVGSCVDAGQGISTCAIAVAAVSVVDEYSCTGIC
jgi:hypothetical protein